MQRSTTSIPFTTMILTAIVASLGACDDGPGGPAVDDRDVVFEGAEVRDQLAADPDAVLFVDLRGSSRVGFEQHDAPLDFSRLEVQGRGMAESVPMDEFADALGIDLRREEFTLQAVDAEEVGFRVNKCQVICMHVQIEDCLFDCR